MSAQPIGVSPVGPAPHISASAGEGSKRPESLFTGSGSDIVVPAPEVQGGLAAGVRPLTDLAVVAPAPGLQGLQRTATGFGVGYVPAIAPAPELPALRHGDDARNASAVGNAAGAVIPPAPSVQKLQPSATGARPSAPYTPLQAASNPGSLQGDGNSAAEGPGSGLPAKTNLPSPPGAPANDDPKRVAQEFPIHLIALATALPTSSYFSNYEVFIAERRIGKTESQLIKLVYEFLPYQRRLSEYGTASSGIHRLRVRRDPTCDEGLLDMTWPDAKSGPQQPAPPDAWASARNDPNRLLPCYRTNADDYRKALSRHNP